MYSIYGLHISRLEVSLPGAVVVANSVGQATEMLSERLPEAHCEGVSAVRYDETLFWTLCSQVRHAACPFSIQVKF